MSVAQSFHAPFRQRTSGGGVFHGDFSSRTISTYTIREYSRVADERATLQYKKSDGDEKTRGPLELHSATKLLHVDRRSTNENSFTRTLRKY